jgi:benzoate membrane transport protein
MAVLHASGYPVRSEGIMTVTGIVSGLLAPFGSHAVNLASLTAAICTGAEAHEDPSRRYVAGIFCGLLYLVVGMFGATLASLFAALPSVFIAVLAGLALMGAFTAGLAGIFADSGNSEPGIVAFLATASGMELLGIGSPFWGLVLGAVSCLALKKRTG